MSLGKKFCLVVCYVKEVGNKNGWSRMLQAFNGERE